MIGSGGVRAADVTDDLCRRISYCDVRSAPEEEAERSRIAEISRLERFISEIGHMIRPPPPDKTRERGGGVKTAGNTEGPG